MALYRNCSMQLLAALALGLQLLIASGLAMSPPSAHCGAAHTQATDTADCQACGAHDLGRAHSNGLCKVACAVASVAAPLPLRFATRQAPRDVAPTSASRLQDQSSPSNLLRPPAAAAVRAA